MFSDFEPVLMDMGDHLGEGGHAARSGEAERRGICRLVFHA